VLLRINHEEPGSLLEFQRQTAANVGREITLTVSHSGREKDIKVTPSAEAPAPLGVIFEPLSPGTVRLDRVAEQGVLYASYQIVYFFQTFGVLLRKLVSPPLMYHDVHTHFDVAFLRQLQLYPERPDIALLAGFMGVMFLLFVLECLFSFWHMLTMLYSGTRRSIGVILAVVGVTLASCVLVSAYDLQIYEFLAQFDILRALISYWIV
jgi:hypothetical protein